LGNVIVVLAEGTPEANQPVYMRIVASLLPTLAVGGFEASSDTVTQVGTAASGTSVTLGAGTGVAVGQLVTGAGIAGGTYVAGISGTGLTLSKAITAALSSTTLTFANNVALPGVVFRTGFVDANNSVEITIKVRNAA
jgi:hypothetical protein